MGGGKETPRQKMIGMMYLVLMAMLALNVSKSIIDAFIAIEENIQIANQNEHARGTEKLEQLMEQANHGESPEVKAKAKKYLQSCQAIDKITAEQIQYLDALKMEILSEIKEEEKLLQPGPESIITTPFDPKFPLRPIRMNLSHVSNKDKYDEGMRIFGIAENLAKPASYACKSKYAQGRKGGIDVWESLLKYRGDLCSLLVASSTTDKAKFSFVDPKIVKFENLADLQKSVKEGFKKCKIDPEDTAEVSKIYISLTKNEILHEGDHGSSEKIEVHWLGKTFNHAPSVAAIASISGLQKEILTARADAVSLIRSKLGGGEYSFNKIVGLAFPETAVLNPGDQFEVTVMMAAFDSDKQPVVKPSQGSVTKIEDGRATLKLTAPSSGEMVIKGSVGVANKRGQVAFKEYETKVQVAPKAGSLEMPEFNILYRGYGNKIIASASGVISTSISAPGCTVTPTTINGRKGFAVKPGPGTKSVVISLSGKDAKGKSVSFGSTTYSVKSFPKPVITTRSISKGGGRIQVALENSPINATFKIKSIAVGDDFSGSSDVVPASALAKSKVGKNVSVVVTAINSLTNESVDITGALKVTN